MDITCTTDPISGKDLHDVSKLPFVQCDGEETRLRIYFESEDNRRRYLEIPVETPSTELHSVRLDNPTDEQIDEG
jgi:hypothetical protein